METIQELRTKLPRRERRVIADAQSLRAAGDTTGMKIGMRIPFGKRSVDMGFSEIIDPGAFTKTLQETGSDIRSLWNHMTEWVLGRESNDTLRLVAGPDGLDAEVTLDPKNFMHREVFAPTVARGDVTGSSFGFETVRDDWLTEPDGTITRTLLEVKLYEVSPVTFPAYPDSEADSRSVREARAATLAAVRGIDPIELMAVLHATDGRVADKHVESVRRWIGQLQKMLPEAPAVPAEVRARALALLGRRHGLRAMDMAAQAAPAADGACEACETACEDCAICCAETAKACDVCEAACLACAAACATCAGVCVGEDPAAVAAACKACMACCAACAKRCRACGCEDCQKCAVACDACAAACQTCMEICMDAQKAA